MADTSVIYDVAVIGAGFVGSSAAYHLAKSGKQTVLLDQFSLPHARGSSCGHQRCTTEMLAPPLVPLATFSARFFQEMEETSGTKLGHKTGGVLADRSPSDTVQGVGKLLTSIESAHEMMSCSELDARFPGVQFGEQFEGLLEKEAYIYRCDKVMQKLRDEFQQNGGTIKELHSVQGVEPSGGDEPVRIQTSEGTVMAKAVVLAAGPWSGRLLKDLGLDLPLEVLQANMLYYREKIPGQYSINRGYPWWMILGCRPDTRPSASSIFIHPSFDYPGCCLVVLFEETTVDPGEPTSAQASSKTVDETNEFVAQCFPGLHPTPSVANTSMVTYTPDDLFIIDTHPKYENIVVGAGMSGLGFLTSPAVGKALCDLVLKQTPSFDLTAFRMSRFDKH